ncbi:shikimate dehydrogenase [Lacticaseibacillus baoqingensis]|uniref:Shikimate dehydrogenase (NADP(+)) n=1 Tax=Lacticaseibacillus baoqingensis TaxID=2486013 RepID=A0ABW4EAM2_9LACO|nr:shikimate dehydrogenase [Lacticaseibacillus baoqingensis]
MIDAKTKLYGLIAHPSQHSLSPAMHNFAFEQLKINARYLAFDVTPATLAEAIAGLRAFGIGGVNLSMPLKEAVLPLLDELDPLAKLAGSVNTIVNQGGRLYGYTTDGVGVVAALPQRLSLKTSRAVLFGAGGAARSAALALGQAGVAELVIINRHQAAAETLAAQVNQATGVNVTVCALADTPQVGALVAASQLVINATSLGMGTQQNTSPLADAGALNAQQVVLDMVYAPLNTRFLQQAAAAGVHDRLNGLALLVAQGAASFKLWTGANMPTAAVEAHLSTLLAQH